MTWPQFAILIFWVTVLSFFGYKYLLEALVRFFTKLFSHRKEGDK